MNRDRKQDSSTDKQRRWYHSRLGSTASWLILGTLALIFLRQVASFF